MSNTRSKVRVANSMMGHRAAARNTAATANTGARSRLMATQATRLETSMIGERTAMRMSICAAFCILVTSVVMRVTRPAVENRSMLENE